MTSQTRAQVINDRALPQQYLCRSFSAKVPAGSLDVQSQLVEQIMQFAFDTLGANHLDVRVLGAREESRSSQMHSRLF